MSDELGAENRRLREKLRELEAGNNDLANLLTATDIATIFLDTALRIRRFTPAASALLNVTAGDVGRTFSDLAPQVRDRSLTDDAAKVLEDLQPREADVAGEDGHSFIRRVSPYRTNDNRTSGVVVTYSDVSRLRDALKHLRHRERQQAAVAELGMLTAGDMDRQELLDRAVEGLARNLGCTHAKVLELDAERRVLTLRAAVGFARAVVGQSAVSADLNSQAGFTLREAAPVIVEDLPEETRFQGPALLIDEGIKSGISVTIGVAESPWGILSVHSTEKRRFSRDDVSFLQSVANLLHTAIEQKRLRDHRDELADRLETVLGATNTGTWIWDLKTNIVHGDERMRELFGTPERSSEPERFFEIIHASDRERVIEATQQARSSGDYSCEFRIVRPDGEIRWLAGFGRLTRDRQGKQLLVGINYDITERRTAEHTLVESEQRREMALSAARMGSWEWRPGSDVLTVDERLAELLEEKAGRLPQARLREKLHPDDWDMRAAKIEKAIDEGGDFDNEYRYFRRGEERWMQSTGRVYGGREDGIVIGLAWDITDRKREEARREILTAELDHRVKNILANVNAIARQTGHTQREPEAFMAALEGRLSAMAEAHSLLSVTQWSGVELRALVDAELSPYAADTTGRVTVEGGPYNLSPRAAQTLCLFLHELATNAAKYGALKDPAGKLRIVWAVDSGNNLVFSWDERVPEAVAAPGHRGFGLSVIEEMTAADLQASVHIDFREEGLYCRLQAPRAEVAATFGSDSAGQNRPLPHRRAQRSEAPEPSGAKRILVVEDAWAVAMHLKSLLEQRNHSVVGPVGRLKEGLALVSSQEVDAAILDVRLHDELVFPLASELKKRAIPFGFATGYDDAGILPEEFADRPVMAKPYGEEALDRLVAKLVTPR